MPITLRAQRKPYASTKNESFESKWGSKLSADLKIMAEALGEFSGLFTVSQNHSTDDFYNECHRICQQWIAKNHQ